MSHPWSRSRLPARLAVLAAGAALLLSAPGPSPAGGPPYGIPSGVMPWEYHKYQGYKEPARSPRPAQPATPVARSPVKYTLRITVVPYEHTHEDRSVALVVAHVPEDAGIWFEGDPTRLTGSLRYFTSPPLKPGKRYTYTVQVQWYEDGQWVSQSYALPVRAGGVHCLDVVPSRAPDVETEVAANLAKLLPNDRDSAGRQKFCAVQEGVRLGAMGVPLKVQVKGESVFLCCKGCEQKANSAADGTLETARKLKAANAAGAPR
ncbi:MAG: TIGR03000 domain-containing protein [Gemmataceae bacterium]